MEKYPSIAPLNVLRCRRNRWSIAALFVLLCTSLSARGELSIEITHGADNPTRIAVVPMTLAGGQLPGDISAIVSADLDRSGLFRTMARENMLSFPRTMAEVYYRDWSVAGIEYLVVADVQRPVAGRIKVTFSLAQVAGERQIFTKVVEGSDSELRDIAHHISDVVFEAITGIRGAFSTRIAYVTATPEGGKLAYRLLVSDADGARERLMLKSKEPILSPRWSPDGRELVYVSFETRRPAVFRQRLSDAQREQVTNFRGLNGAPAWSPDGRSLALVLSKDGNPEIYLYTFATKAFTRLTNHSAIDTEPTWTPDGKAVLFTSDRGGSPQIYKLTLAGNQLTRVTFNGKYNARPQLAADGRTLVMVHRGEGGGFVIASQDLVTNDFRGLTQSALDESPTVAPNGAMVMYTSRQGRRTVLAVVSIDARVRFLLPSQSGDVREPAWSPFLK
ncbi:MAG: Tol-Pal system beta propeller repeat protein TolB [Porticoccaceae bacterium]